VGRAWDEFLRTRSRASEIQKQLEAPKKAEAVKRQRILFMDNYGL
jgi:hypothetical protein